MGLETGLLFLIDPDDEEMRQSESMSPRGDRSLVRWSRCERRVVLTCSMVLFSLYIYSNVSTL